MDKWTTWKCHGDVLVRIRAHLKKFHFNKWRGSVIEYRLKNWEDLVNMELPITVSTRAPSTRRTSGPNLTVCSPSTQETFTHEGFLRRLENLIVRQDMVSNQ